MENMIINDLVREYMQYNNYNHSLSVFTPETGMGEELLDRNFIA
jgi:lisH domain-containing protein FOPNL